MRVRSVAVAALFAAVVFAAAPTPESHFGHKIGQDRTLLDWPEVVSYFQKLDEASDRVQVRELGKSTEGRPFIAAWISSAENLKNLARFQQIQKRLADPRQTPAAEAEKLVAEGKTVVMITCSIHSTEVASTMTAVEFAHRLATEDRPKFRAILDNVVFILVPSLNPDGIDLVARWYRKTLDTPFEGTSPPELYQKYVGHDNNRDWYIFSQAETRIAVSQLHNVWHPQIVYDVHQQGQFVSRMFVPPWLDPIEPNIDPAIAQMCNMIGAGMAADLTAAGKKGIAINASYDFWTPGRHYQAYHGGMRILSESASARIASPITVEPEQIEERSRGYSPRERSWNHLEPWPGGEWRVRDIIDYQSIAWESVLFQATVHREDLLRNFYRIGARAAARTLPYAFVIPAAQHDPGATRKLLETLAFGLVEIETAQGPFVADGKQYPAGTFVIRMQQPYSSWAKALLERQEYPDLREYPGGPPRRPYDVTAHTLPLLMGVEAVAVREPIRVQLAPAPREAVVALKNPRPGWAVSDTATWQEVARRWQKGAPVWQDAATGNFFAEAGGGRVEHHPQRLGLYRSHMPSMDEGWTRWLLEQFGFAYRSVGNAQIQAGGLRDRFDVLLFPDQTASAIAQGHKEGAMPSEYIGGLGEKGAAALKEFAQAGGTAIFLNHSGEYATQHLDVNVKNVVRGLSSREFYCPGSLLNARLDPAHRLSRGLPEQIAIWSEGSPAWEVPEGAGIRVVASYGEAGLLASGWLLGEKHLAGRAALVEAPVGKGRIILFGMRPQYRAQSYATFKVLFNALLSS